MSTSTVTDMNLGSSKPTSNRRKPKGSELKKHRQPQRGMGVAQLEHQRTLEEYKNKMTQIPFTGFNPSLGLITTSSSCTPVQNVAVQFHPVPVPSPAMFVQSIGIHNPNMYSVSTDHVMDQSVVVGSSNTGFRFENPVQNYVKCGFDGCGVCHKKKRISGGSNLCSVTPFRSFCGNNVEMIDGKTRRSSGQVTEAKSVNRNSGGSMTEYEFFPGKVEGAEEYKEWIRIGSTATAATWCGSGGGGGSVVGGLGLGLRGGEGSCVTAVTGSEEGSVSSLDLSLKLSY